MGRTDLGPFHVGDICIAWSHFGASSSWSMFFPLIMNWLFEICFLWWDALLYLSAGRRSLVSQFDTPYFLTPKEFWGVDGWAKRGEGGNQKNGGNGSCGWVKNNFLKCLKMNSYTNELNFLSSSNYHRSFNLHIIQTYPVAAHEQSTENNKI